MAPVALRLGMDNRVTVDFTRRGLEDLGPYTFGQPQHVDGPVHTGLGGLHRIILIMNGRCRAGQIVDLIYLHIEREGDIMPHQFKMWIIKEMQDILLVSGKVVIDAEDIVSILEQTFTEMGAEKAGPSSH